MFSLTTGTIIIFSFIYYLIDRCNQFIIPKLKKFKNKKNELKNDKKISQNILNNNNNMDLNNDDNNNLEIKNDNNDNNNLEIKNDDNDNNNNMELNNEIDPIKNKMNLLNEIKLLENNIQFAEIKNLELQNILKSLKN
jgi:hypothetical protein